ncbi:MAG: hypothetical protein MJ107_03755 [Lachnospiraceae bacterium]|nr:hypothetical protein [Lachnospiraceae bacterium]
MSNTTNALTNKKTLKISAISFGNKYAVETLDEMKKLSNFDMETVAYKNSIRGISEATIGKLDSDLLYVVIEAQELTGRTLNVVERIIAKSGALAIGICIGENISTKDIYKFETLTKAFYFPKSPRIHKYIALITNMINGAVHPETLIGFDLGNLNSCLKGKRNRAWFGKAYGKQKGKDLADHFIKSDWYEDVPRYSCDSVVVVISGDISLTDASDVFSTISEKLTDEAYSLISVSYDDEAFEEMSMMVIDSR